MKKINMKKGFTMIELVFVIVIIGILSAVALPKFFETSQQAHHAVIKAFQGTLNRTVGPTMWAASISDGLHGNVFKYCEKMTEFTEIPDELVYKNYCKFHPKPGGGAIFGIDLFRNGNEVTTPHWGEPRVPFSPPTGNT